MADPSVVDARCQARGGEGCECSFEPYDMGGYTAKKWLCELDRFKDEPSVVDSGEARDPGVAGALNTLRERIAMWEAAQRAGGISGMEADALAALARVETALADPGDGWVRKSALTVTQQARESAEARAVAAEAALAESERERDNAQQTLAAIAEITHKVSTKLLHAAHDAWKDGREFPWTQEQYNAETERVVRELYGRGGGITNVPELRARAVAAEAERDDAKLALDELHREAMASIEHVKAERDALRQALERLRDWPAAASQYAADDMRAIARAVLAGEEPT